MLTTIATTTSGPEMPLRPPEECIVIIVDDDDRIIDALAHILSRDGYQIITTTNGQEGLNLILDSQPDVAIIDVLLPGTDGIQICKSIKSDPKTQFLPVILMTGLAARDRQHEGLVAGADDFLNKPIDPLELTARVRSLIRTKQLYEILESNRQELEDRVAERTEELRNAYQQLQQLDKIKSNVLAIVAHELRTPLMKIKSGLWLASQEDIPSQEKSNALQVLNESLEQLSFRITDIDLFSDPENLKMAPVSARDLLAGSVQQVRVLQPHLENEIEVSFEDNIPPLFVDSVVMTRVLVHILDNAIKFGNKKPVTVRCYNDQEKIAIEIIDSGPGMTSEVLDEIYVPFSQGDVSSTRKYAGMGIGLSLVKMVLDAHHGEISIQSSPGEGTSVVIRVNAASPI